MSIEQVKLYRLLVLDASFAAPGTVEFSTEYLTITRAVAPGVRRPIKLAFPSYAKGRYAKVKVSGTGEVRLFGMTLYGRRISEAQETSWVWTPGPVEGTPETWTVHPLPIPVTPEEWTEHALPIPPTPEEWSLYKLPIRPTQEIPEWFQFPVDA